MPAATISAIFCATKGWSFCPYTAVCPVGCPEWASSDGREIKYFVRVLTGWPLASSVLRLVICSSCRHCSPPHWETLLLILACSKVRVESERLHFHMGLTLYLPGALEPETFTLKWPLFEVLGLSKTYIFSTLRFMPAESGHLNNRSGIHIDICLTSMHLPCWMVYWHFHSPFQYQM